MNLLYSFEDVLPVMLSAGQPVSHWCIHDQNLANYIEGVVNLINNPALVRETNLLKYAKRRLVFKHCIKDLDIVIKAFPLDSIEKKLKHKKYAFTEARNILRAQQRGIPSPKLLGFGMQKRNCLVSWNSVLLEYITDSSMELMLDIMDNLSERYLLLERAFPLFSILYESGCNHIDFKPGSIHLNETDAKIIDFQYVNFLSQPSLRVLAAQAGYFAWNVSVRNHWVAVTNMQDWFTGLLDYLNVTGDDEMWMIFHRTHARRYSIADRMNGVAGRS